MTWRTGAQPLLSKPDVRSLTRYDTGISTVDRGHELVRTKAIPSASAGILELILFDTSRKP
jgi:hypothetical protein